MDWLNYHHLLYFWTVAREGSIVKASEVLLLAPPPVAKLAGFAEMFEGAVDKSRRFAEHYARVAEERGCAFLDTGQVIVSSDLDGIHLEASETVISAVMFRCYTIAT